MDILSPGATKLTSGQGSLSLLSLRKSYGAAAAAVESFSLEISPGEFVTLLGPSGSGKTTTLMMIAGFDAPDSGQIVLDGRDVTRLPAHRRSIGVVFQSYALFPHMTIFDNVGFSLKMRNVGRSEIAQRVREALELVRLAGLESRFPHQLSGGQQQRTALARAIVFRPSILLLDEPLGALDRMLREHMQLELRRMHQQLGATMIYVTHDQDEALVLSDRVVVMNRGAIEQVGTPGEIYNHPKTRFVAEFIGETNFFEASVISRKGSSAQVTMGGLSFAVSASSSALASDRVGVSLRPERINLGAESSAKTMLQGVIEDRIYLGDLVKFRVRVNSNLSMIVKEQSRGNNMGNLNLGSPVTLSWNPADARIVPIR